MSEMILLGAGASIDAGVPGAYEMTRDMLARYQDNARFERHYRVLQFVVGGLLFQLSKRGENPLSVGVNIEDLFNAVQLLAQRHTLEAAPFVGSWDTMVEELDRPDTGSENLDKAIYESVAKQISKALSKKPSSGLANDIDKSFERVFSKSLEAAVKGRSPSLFSSDRLGNAVQKYVEGVADCWIRELRSTFGIGSSAGSAIKSTLQRQIGHGQGQIYEETNEFMVAALKDLVWISNDQRVSYLGPVLNLLDKQERLVVATLNYDNAIELLCASQKRNCMTGIESWQTDSFFGCEAPGLHLLKMHGSIDWQKVDPEDLSEEQAMPVARIRKVNSDEFAKRSFMPAVVFGQRNKLTAEGPFLDLLRAFRGELDKVDTLTVVGYSFRDPHINVFISQWLNKSENRKLRIINGDGFSKSRAEYALLLLSMAKRRPGRVEIVPMFAKDGLQSVYGSYSGEFGVRKEAVSSAVEAVIQSKADNANSNNEAESDSDDKSGVNSDDRQSE